MKKIVLSILAASLLAGAIAFAGSDVVKDCCGSCPCGLCCEK